MFRFVENIFISCSSYFYFILFSDNLTRGLINSFRMLAPTVVKLCCVHLQERTQDFLKGGYFFHG